VRPLLSRFADDQGPDGGWSCVECGCGVVDLGRAGVVRLGAGVKHMAIDPTTGASQGYAARPRPVNVQSNAEHRMGRPLAGQEIRRAMGYYPRGVWHPERAAPRKFRMTAKCAP